MNGGAGISVMRFCSAKVALVVGLDVVERLDDFGIGENGFQVGRGSRLRASLVHQRVLRDERQGRWPGSIV